MKISTEKTVLGYNLYNLEEAPIKEFPPYCRKVAAEGAVLLKNEKNILPFDKGLKVSVFGRAQFDYYKSGTGSGGLVNTLYVSNIIDGLKNSGIIEVNESLYNQYKEWLKDNPFDKGVGWASEPWCQKEMPISAEVAEKCAESDDVALVVIGRTAGEDKDNSNTGGSYLLNEEEREILKNVSAAFDKVCVILNTGNIIDMKFVDEFGIDSVMYVWHGGMEGGNAVSDLLVGKAYPSGKLADTIAYDISDYPSTENFGDRYINYYKEDIYVGYRYFETFCPEKVMYPFGFGLSYTDFEITFDKAYIKNSVYYIEATVKNIGERAGKEVVQCYYRAPQGKLGKPLYQLGGYKKTGELNPGESESVVIEMPLEYMASFDDSGVTGHKNCLILEMGRYELYIGNSIRSLSFVEAYEISENFVLKKLQEAVAPEKPFDRIKPVYSDGKFEVTYEKTPLCEVDIDKRIVESRYKEIEYTGDKGYKLLDVADNNCSMEQFVAQLKTEDLRNIVKGEGMNSHKVTPGTGAAFGGVSDRLLDFGIPIACATDGPSGVRLDSENTATAIPIGTLLACTFNDDAVEKLHQYFGLELRAYKIDALLGPGMNIHRNPLNGRNFEYFSEDPILSGKMAAAACRGIAVTGVTGTIKHFACNSQEIGRSDSDSIVSARALREIYLKGFEIAIKEGNASSIMTGYNSVNGYWCAGNYDLDTIILRKEWKYKGMVMTDWWAKMNCKGGEAYQTNTKQMVRARNDIYMVCKSAENQPDNITEGLEEGYITKADLQMCCIDLLEYLIKTPAFERYVLGGCKKPKFLSNDDSNMTVRIELENIENGKEYEVDIEEDGVYIFVYEVKVEADALAQFYCNVMLGGEEVDAMSLSGTDGKVLVFKQPVTLPAGKNNLKIVADNRFVMKKLQIKK